MEKNILIKYDISGDFEEGNFYVIKFDYHRSSQIQYIDHTFYLLNETLLKKVHEIEIEVQYRGISKVDDKKIFIIDSIQLNRKLQLQKLDLEN